MKYFLLLIYAFFCHALHSQDYEFRYQLKDNDTGGVLSIWNDAGDSLYQNLIKATRGKIALHLNEPTRLTVTVNNADSSIKDFFIDEHGIDSKMDFIANSITIEPTKLNAEFDNIISIRKNIEAFERKVYLILPVADSLKIARDSILKNIFYIEKACTEYQYIEAISNPTSYLSLLTMNDLVLGNMIDKTRQMQLFNKLDPSLQKYPKYKFCQMVLENKLAKKQLGDTLTSYLLMDTGNIYKDIKELVKGRLTYIDLWSFGCGPCRKAHPKLTLLYQKYKDKIQFISISIAGAIEVVKQATIEDKIAWLSLSDTRAETSPFLYQVSPGYIPYGIMVGKDGKIIAKDVRADTLENEIEHALGAAK